LSNPACLVKKPRQVYKEMDLKDEANAPKSMQQLRALKYLNDQKNNSYSGSNVADEVLEVLKMLNENTISDKFFIVSSVLYCIK
jgi:hypothetical protein